MLNINAGQRKKRLYLLIFTLLLCACDNTYTPKPRGYFNIQFPERKYQVFDMPGYPYTFEYPAYARVVQDTLFFSDKPENPYWINIEFPTLHGKIYLSYKQIGFNNNTLPKLVNDAFKMTYKHTYKAESIEEKEISTPNHVKGLFYEVGGNAASAKQFFATDSTQHFLRGALYFDAAPNADSLAPVHKFLEEDMWRLVESLKWK
ncbi:gliding motility lipoprotein GldD [Chitinophaga pendula]|uniref:gliding motility lipoprotein GldD n=1 Tax=Chitinophaga TaxID=79328 RepID=UPI000BAF5D1E|nr:MULTISPECIES: gliding motility lipoprotein GldD [Chitinophaga]ASZ10555.1 gliding motility lipoprotein GldD [Chitinophaga sp. MD30]UCJ06470.1 gliding motility lipoprotein GldD [Chitinophaga pendula]